MSIDHRIGTSLTREPSFYQTPPQRLNNQQRGSVTTQKRKGGGAGFTAYSPVNWIGGSTDDSAQDHSSSKNLMDSTLSSVRFLLIIKTAILDKIVGTYLVK